jgi:hypothetical protein
LFVVLELESRVDIDVKRLLWSIVFTILGNLGVARVKSGNTSWHPGPGHVQHGIPRNSCRYRRIFFVGKVQSNDNNQVNSCLIGHAWLNCLSPDGAEPEAAPAAI